MMGRQEGGQGQFFCSFDLDRVVPPDHLVRQIDVILDLSWVHKELAPYSLILNLLSLFSPDQIPVLNLRIIRQKCP